MQWLAGPKKDFCVPAWLTQPRHSVFITREWAAVERCWQPTNSMPGGRKEEGRDRLGRLEVGCAERGQRDSDARPRSTLGGGEYIHGI